MVKFKLHEKVIVSDYGVNKLGIITGIGIRQKKFVYNVRMENGVEHNLLSVDNKSAKYYIKSELSKHIAQSIPTNLSEITLANKAKK